MGLEKSIDAVPRTQVSGFKHELLLDRYVQPNVSAAEYAIIRPALLQFAQNRHQDPICGDLILSAAMNAARTDTPASTLKTLVLSLQRFYATGHECSSPAFRQLIDRHMA